MSAFHVSTILQRLAISLVLAMIIILGVSELVYRLQREDTSRPPQVVELLIPQGTGEKVANGEAMPGIPEEMIFVVGDTLLVRNEDQVDHELGPLWIPAGKTASLSLGKVNALAYSCSFQPSKYFGLTVKEATTWSSRLAALGYGVPPLAMFFLVYSFVLFPVKPSGGEASEIKD
jgi:hypothetical protein